MPPLLPLIVAVTVSVAVIVTVVAVLKVMLNVPTPFTKTAFAGRMAFASVLVKWAVPV